MAGKLTVLIPCKNERMNIRPCIESVQSIADEVLVADSGSTDDTLAIVRSIDGCRLIEREYVCSADFKNWAIPQAAHEWVLIVDADERVTPKLAKEIRRIVDGADDATKDAYWIGRDNHYLGHPIKRCGWNNDGVVRLVRRDACRYTDRWVHAEIDAPAERVGRLQGRFVHYTTWDSDHYSRKMVRYAEWGARNYHQAGKHPNLLKLALAAPVRFLQLYLLRGGFLDGIPGLQVCMHSAYYSYQKQAKLWEMHYALPQPDPELERDNHNQQAA
ncbi:glycosyltransferase family 2 protein [Aeoliella mucimassa]|uniref:Glycosyl transferase family 2 n=1 Tax=Aeoliella mucimassa TaxID=2527972 RepID=A0A518AHN2_9BACT|nr:glycosyltransferase family 2 protein [Aeoliella mucimassa]QDU54205.1 Glycosyl transferase family 2 [Aeoliella mucimassa]